LHKNAFGGRALPKPAGGAILLRQAPSHYKGDGKARRGRKQLGIRRGGREGVKGPVRMDAKEKRKMGRGRWCKEEQKG